MSQNHTDYEKVTPEECEEVDSLPRGSPDSQKEMISPSGANREPQSPVVEDEDSSLGLKVDEDGSHENQGQVEGEGSPQTEEETTARGDRVQHSHHQGDHHVDQPDDVTESPDSDADTNTNPNAVEVVTTTSAETSAVGDTDSTNAETSAVGNTDSINADANAVGGTDATNADANAVGDTDATNAETNAVGDTEASDIHVQTNTVLQGDTDATNGETSLVDGDANTVGDTDAISGKTNTVGNTDVTAPGDSDTNAEVDANSDTLSEEGSTVDEEEGEGGDGVPVVRERRRRRRGGSDDSELESGEEDSEKSRYSEKSRSTGGDVIDEGWEEGGGAREESRKKDGGAGEEGWEEEGGAGEEGRQEKAEGEEQGKERGQELEKDSPMFVPTRGRFFEHDMRYTEGEEEGKKQEEPIQTFSTRADKVEKWQHDLYKEDEQRPREQWEKDRDVKIAEALERKKAQRGQRREATLGNWMPTEGGERGQREPRQGWGRPRDQEMRRSGDRSNWTRSNREGQHAVSERSPREDRQRRVRPSDSDRVRGKRTDVPRSKPPGEAATAAEASGLDAVVPDTQWDVAEVESNNPKDADGKRKSVSPVTENAGTKVEDTKRSPRSPLSSGGSSTQQTKVFSLNLESKLQVKSEDARVRGKARGRGWKEKFGAPKIGASRNTDPSTNNGIIVIEPLEKRLPSEQTEDSQEQPDQEGYIPSAHRLPSTQKTEQDSPSQGKPQVASVEGEQLVQEGTSDMSALPPAMQSSLAQGSKPKRYSSRRQKMDPTTEGQPQGYMREIPQPGAANPWVARYLDPTNAAMYQEMVAQQMKVMANSGSIPPGTGMSSVPLQPNPLMMQWLWYMQQQQAAYQQQNLLQMEMNPVRAPPHGPPPPRAPEIVNYSQVPLQQSVPVAATMDQEGIKQGFTSPGLFIPSIAPEEQRRHQQQMLSKPKSQAIPILPPKDEQDQA